MSNILIVEDKASIRITLRAVIEAEGHSVECSENGQKALQLLSEKDDHFFDLIISDIIMPEVNGIEFITGIRATNNQTPVLFISGGGYNMMADDILDAAKEIADGILKKPFKNAALLEMINSLIPS